MPPWGRVTPEVDVDATPATAPPGAPLRSGLAPGPRPAPAPRSSSAPRVFSAPLHAATPLHEALHQAERREARPQPKVFPAPAAVQLRRAQEMAPLAALREADRKYGLQQRMEAAYRRRLEPGGGALNIPGVVNLGGVVGAIANAHLLPQGSGVLGTLGRVGNEAIDMPAQTFLSGAMAGSAASQAARGNTAPGSAILGSFAHQLTHPVESFEQAPLSTALLFAGGENVLGRLAGKAGRALAPADSAVGRALSPARPDLQLLGPDNVQTLRTYNSDPLRKAGQVAYEKALTSKALPEGIRQQDPFVAEGWRLRRNLVGTAFKPGSADAVANAQEAQRRGWVKNTAEAAAEAHPGKLTEHLVPLIAQRVVRTPETALADLQRLRDQWAGAQSTLSGGKLAANKANVANLDAMLKNPGALQAALPDAFASSARIEQLQKPATAVRVAARQLDPTQLRAALFPYAQMHMGAVYHTAADHMALERQALAPERAAHGAVEGAAAALPDARTALARAEAVDKVRTVDRLAQRPGTPAEGAAAVAARDKTIERAHELGVQDLREVPSVQDARARVAALEQQHANGQINAMAARQHRYEVSGRGADRHAEYEHAVGQHVEAADALKRAEARVAREGAARSQLVRQQAQNRAADMRGTGGAVRTSSAGDVAAKARREASLAQAKEGLRSAQAAERAAREARPPPPPTEAALRTAAGKHLPNEAILEHMAAQGLKPPGFLSHEVGIKGNRSFYQSVRNLPAAEKYHRTGASFANGTADHSWQALLGTVASGASKAAKIEARTATLQRMGIGGEHGTFFTDHHAAQAARDNLMFHADGGQVHALGGDVVPVHAGNGQIVKATDVHPHGELPQILHQFGLAEHAPADVANNGKYALMHKGVADRLQAHEDAMSTRGDLGKFLQLYQQAFRHAKLNTSMPHIAGVVQEQAIRLAAEGVAPAVHVLGHDVGGTAGRAGSKVTRNLMELAQKDVHGRLADNAGPLGADFRRYEAQLANRGGLAGSQRALDVQRVKGNQFQSALGSHGAGAIEGAGHTLPGRAVRAAWRGWSAAVEGSLAKVEHGTRDALLAKALKDSGLIPNYRSLIRMQDVAMKEWLAGTLTPARADALARAVDDMGGNWNRQTPLVRKVVGKAAPFGLWWLNSMRWLYRLPVTHPVKTAIAAGLYQATREQRAAKGQGFDAAHPVPAFLQGEIKVHLPVVGEVGADPTHYSPGGTGGPEALHTFIEQFLPAAKGVYAGAEGVNPLSKRILTDAHGKALGTGAKALNTLGELVAGPTPFASQAEKVLQQGGKPYGTSNLLTDIASKLGGEPQVKPGTERPWDQVIAKLLSPERFNFPAAGTGGGGGGGGGGGLSPAELHEVREAAKAASGLSPAEAAEVKRLALEARQTAGASHR